MKYIKVANFIELSSNVLLKTLDHCYELEQMVDNENIFVNFKDKRIKCFFIDNLFKEVKHHYSFGEKLIIINTCKPFSNWRKETRGHSIKSYRYNLSDSSIKINLKILEQFLDYCWDFVSKKSDFVYLSNECLDSLDLKTILIKEIGDDVVTHVPSKFLVLSDPNYEYIRKSSDIIPEYLCREIKTQLIEKGII